MLIYHAVCESKHDSGWLAVMTTYSIYYVIMYIYA